MNIKYWSILFLLLISASAAATEGGATTVQEEQHLKVALRMIGHKLLHSLGDSTSRVLPVKQQNGQYIVPINTDFQFEPSELVALIEQVAKSIDFPAHYIVEVEACASEEIVYAYEIGMQAATDIVPCKGRVVPKACYHLLFTFPGLTHPVSKAEAGTESLLKKGSLLLTGLLLLIVPLLFISKLLSGNRELTEREYIGRFAFDRKAMQLSWEGETIELTAKEFELLTLLLAHSNETLEREVLLENVWGDEGNYVGRTLDVFISRLRKKLEADPAVRIANIRGVGYKLVIAK